MSNLEDKFQAGYQVLKALRIKDFAIIDELSLEFQKGFTVFTGETGAGKSILIDAIGLLVGGRAASDAVRDGSHEAVVEGIFEDTGDAGLRRKLAGYGISADENEILIRRNISVSGKNRVYINGALSTLSMLEDICSGLVDIHGQHEHQKLLRRDMHIEYLDAFGKLMEPRERIKERYHYINRLKDRLSRLEEGLREKREREELYRYQLSEIKAAGLKEGEDRDLALERDVLCNSKRLSTLSDEAYSLLYDDEGSVLARLGRIEEDLAEISKIDPAMGEAGELVRSSRANLREASDIIRRFRDNVRYDPERTEKIEERLYLIERLKKKYGQSIEEIIAYQSKIESDLEALEYSDQDIAGLKEEMGRVLKDMESGAGELSKLRNEASKRLEEEVMKELSFLQMGDTRFMVSIERMPLSQDGLDSVELMIANLNEEPRPLARVASGGELSRLMLAIKCCLSAVDSVPTMIFDEVDAGIGGMVAEEVGSRLKYLSKDHQVCCVTHLPQIAAMADNHCRVEKIVADGRVTARVKRLDKQERIEEIGRMLAGREKTKTAMKYAEEMIKGR